MPYKFEDGQVIKYEVQDVATETHTKDQILSELDSVQSELDNFDVVMQKRENRLKERQAELKTMLNLFG